MSDEIVLLNNCLIVGALLFGIGIVGFLSRRNMIVMFLSLEIALQGVSLSLAAWSRYRNDFGGQSLALFMVAVAACEAAIALTLVLALFNRLGKLDAADWQLLREANLPAFSDKASAEVDEQEIEPMPQLPPAGVRPEISSEETDYRPRM